MFSLKFWSVVVLSLGLLNSFMETNCQAYEAEKIFKIESAKLKVNIEVDAGEVEVRKNSNVNECRIFYKYDGEKMEKEIDYDESRNLINIVFDQEFPWHQDSDHKDDNHLKVEVLLPEAPQIDLQANIKAGEIDFELGDLRLKSVELRNWAGDVSVDFDKPNLVRMTSFEVNVKVGELKIANLGNANFEVADINSGIGEMRLDFSGAKLKDATADVDLDIGETTIIIPENSGTKMKVSKFLFLSEVNYPNWFEKRGSYYYSENFDKLGEHLNLRISTGIGELKIRVQ
ncbi:hypothetical protein JW964_25150 [candidate division KSB1 bacterium]|nr:hypothetical protein [candidate division KSB1 bacterium]